MDSKAGFSSWFAESRIRLTSILSGPRVAISKNWAEKVDNISALPHIAAIGDSTITDFSCDSLLKMLIKVWGNKSSNWYLNSKKSNGINSMFERIDKKRPLIAYQYSTPGGEMDFEKKKLIRKLINKKTMSEQINQLIKRDRFPDLSLVWIGHSLLYWTKEVKSLDKDKRKSEISSILIKFRKEFQEQLERLCQKAIIQNGKRAILVFSLINLEPLIRLRKIEEIKKIKNLSLYPYFNAMNEIFPSLNPEYRKETFKLSDNLNKEIKKSVDFLQDKYKQSNLKIVYSDVFTKANSRSIKTLSDSDGWHPSAFGHQQLARAAYPVIKKQLEFLGIL